MTCVPVEVKSQGPKIVPKKGRPDDPYNNHLPKV